MKINWEVRFSNPVFYAQLLLAILTPALAYLGMSFEDLTSWNEVGHIVEEAYSNPYLLGLIVISIFNATTDPTVSGVNDSELSRSYQRPKKHN
jgi:phi LC3 family holin